MHPIATYAKSTSLIKLVDVPVLCPLYRDVTVSDMCRPGVTGASSGPHLSDLLADNSWRPHLADEFQKPYFHKLEKFIKQEWNTQQVFPTPSHIFRYCAFPSPGHTYIALVHGQADHVMYTGHSTHAPLMMSRL